MARAGARASRLLEDAAPGARNIPFAEDAVAAYFCAFDTNTPFRVRAMLMGALAYFVMPIDAFRTFSPASASPTTRPC